MQSSINTGPTGGGKSENGKVRIKRIRDAAIADPANGFAQLTGDGKGTTVEETFVQDVADGHESRDIYIVLASPNQVAGIELLKWSDAAGFQKEQEDDLIKANFKTVFIASQDAKSDRAEPWKQDWVDWALDLHRFQSESKSVDCIYDALVFDSDNHKRMMRDCTNEEVREKGLEMERRRARNPVQAENELGGARRRLKPLKNPLILASTLAKNKLNIEEALLQKKHILINGNGIAKETFRVYMLMFVLMVVNTVKAYYLRTRRTLRTVVRLEECAAFELIAPFIPEFMMTLRSPWEVFFDLYSQSLAGLGDYRADLMTNAPIKRFFGVGSDEDMEIISRFVTLAGFDSKRLHFQRDREMSDGVTQVKLTDRSSSSGESVRSVDGVPKTTKQKSGGTSERTALIAKHKVVTDDHYMDLSTQQGDAASGLFRKTKGEHLLIGPGVVIPDAYEAMLPPVWGKGEPDEQNGRFDVTKMPDSVKAEYPFDELFPNKIVTLYEYRLALAIHRQKRNPIYQKVSWNVTTPPREMNSASASAPTPTPNQATNSVPPGTRVSSKSRRSS